MALPSSPGAFDRGRALRLGTRPWSSAPAGALDRGRTPQPGRSIAVERRGWGVFKAEVYPTYDFVPVRERIRERVRNGSQ